MRAIGKLFSGSTSKSSERNSFVPSHPSIPEQDYEGIANNRHDPYQGRLSTEKEEEMVIVIEENERLNDNQWSHNHLRQGIDPLPFKSSAGHSTTFPNPPLLDGWIWAGPWEIEQLDVPDTATLHINDRDWVYAMTFEELENGLVGYLPFDRSHRNYQVRQRRWIRAVKPASKDVVGLPHDKNARDMLTPRRSSVKIPFDSHASPSGMRTPPQIEDDSLGDDDASQADTASVLGGFDAKFEVEEDDDMESSTADNDVAERTRRGLIFTRTASISTSKIPIPEFTIRVRDPTLVSIGKQIKTIEAECKSIDDSDLADWTKYNKPALVIQIRELEKYCSNLKV